MARRWSWSPKFPVLTLALTLALTLTLTLTLALRSSPRGVAVPVPTAVSSELSIQPGRFLTRGRALSFTFGVPLLATGGHMDDEDCYSAGDEEEGEWEGGIDWQPAAMDEEEDCPTPAPASASAASRSASASAPRLLRSSSISPISPHISPISPYISPISRPHLAHISPTSRHISLISPQVERDHAAVILYLDGLVGQLVGVL